MNLSSVQIGITQYAVTAVILYIEAIIHYNMGRFDGFTTKLFTIPGLKHNIKVIGTIILFAAISYVVSYFFQHQLIQAEKKL